jgi:hypothetical protein
MSMSRTRTISSWSSAKTASLITSAEVQNLPFSVCLGGAFDGVHARKRKNRVGVGGGGWREIRTEEGGPAC